MQWYGGLAIVVLAVVLVLAPGLAARRLGETESGAPDVIGGARTRARYALVVYVLLTAIAFFLLVLAGTTPFDALAYALSAVSTGGFSTHNNGLAGLGNLPVEWIPIGMASCGAVSLTLYAHIRQGRWQDAVRNKNLHAFAWTTLVSATLVSVFMIALDGLSLEDALWHGPLVAISAQTTSGFSSVDISTLSAPSKLTLIGSMFIGGDEGSTAGGIKIPRLLILMALVRMVLMRTRLPPHAVSEPVAAGRRIEESELHAALAVIILHAVVILLSWMAFVACGHDVLDALFDVTSAVGTVGLSAGIVNENLAAGLKWLLTADMLMGRLEVVAVIVLFSPATWFGRRSEAS
jgi:trk system potassium uptake protein TrkH